MALNTTTATRAIPAGTQVLIAYPVKDGTHARFLLSTTKAIRPVEESERLYGPASFLEGVTLQSALAEIPAFASLATPPFEQTLLAITSDALGPDVANRFAVLQGPHHLLVMDSNALDTL